MDFLSKRYTLKEGSVKEPLEYLGNQVGRWDMHDPLNLGRQCWAMSSYLYMKHAVGEVEKELSEVHQQLRLPSKVSMPLLVGYRPEVDGTKLLGPRQASYFQGLIGVLHWICKLGRINILHNVAVMLRFLAAPREGHLEQCFHIFAYLKKYSHSKIIFMWVSKISFTDILTHSATIFLILLQVGAFLAFHSLCFLVHSVGVCALYIAFILSACSFITSHSSVVWERVPWSKHGFLAETGNDSLVVLVLFFPECLSLDFSESFFNVSNFLNFSIFFSNWQESLKCSRTSQNCIMSMLLMSKSFIHLRSLFMQFRSCL